MTCYSIFDMNKLEIWSLLQAFFMIYSKMFYFNERFRYKYYGLAFHIPSPMCSTKDAVGKTLVSD